MPLFNKAVATIATVTLIFTLTACSSDDLDSTRSEPIKTASSEPTPVKTTSATSEEDAQAVADTYNTFIEGVYNVDKDKLTALYEKFNGTEEPTEEKKIEILNEVREVIPALNAVDVEGKSADEQAGIYGPIITLAAFAADSDVSAKIAADKVTINLNEAFFLYKDVVVTQDGQQAEADSSTGDTKIEFIKKNDKWFIIPTAGFLSPSAGN